MKLNKIKILAFLSLILLTELFSKDLTSNSKRNTFSIADQSAWTISHTLESSANYSQAIIIPFNYPLEARFLSDLAIPQNLSPKNLVPELRNTFSLQIPNFNQTIIQPFTNSEIIAHRTNIITDNAHYARDTNSRLPNLWQLNSPMANTSSGIVFMYLKKNMGLNLDLSFRMAGNEAGHATLESLSSNINLSYNLSNKFLRFNPSYRLNVILQFSNAQSYDDRIVPKKLDFNKTTLKSQFISSGFTLNTKSLMFEGLIRLPIQQQAIFDLDGLLRPELQGRLGMKWNLPDYIQP